MKFRANVVILFLWIGVFASSCSLLPREKVWLYFPQDMATVGEELTIEGRAYDRDGITGLVLSIVHSPTGRQTEYPLHRLASVSGGKVLVQLSKFRQIITFGDEGAYVLTVSMTDKSGHTFVSKPVNIRCVFGTPGSEFKTFSRSHWIPLLILLLMNIVMVGVCRRSETAAKNIPYAISAILWGNELVFHLWHFLLGSWSITTNLLLHMCGMAIVFIPFMLHHPNEKVKKALFNLLYFWGFGGALQALLTPDIGVYGFPSYRYFAAFISHGFIITAVVYMIWVKKYRISFSIMWKVYAITVAFVIVMYGVDLLIAYLPPYEPGSYFFLIYPPVDGSVIDLLVKLFGPSPRYILGLLLLGLGIFIILTIPFALSGSVVSFLQKRRMAYSNSGVPDEMTES